MKYVVTILMLCALIACANQPERIREAETPEAAAVHALGLTKGMKRTIVEKKVAALVGKQSGYSDTPMGTAGGMVTYHLDGGVKLEVIYKRGSPAEYGVDAEGNDDYTPAVDEEVMTFDIKKLSPEIATRIAPEFGKIMTIRGRFVTVHQWVNTELVKPHVHPDQYTLEVLSVDGVILESAVKMRFRIDDPAFRPESSAIYTMADYETVRPVGKPWGWDRKPSYYGYQLANELVVKLKE